MSDFPKDSVDTGKTINGVGIQTSEVVPLCYHSFIMRGVHGKTGKPGWFAFCKRYGKLEKLGPYRTAYEAVEMQVLLKGCDTCVLNIDEKKGEHLEYIAKMEAEIKKTYKDTKILQSLTGPLSDFVYYRVYVNQHFRSLFKTDFFNPTIDDATAIIDCAKPAITQNDFSTKICAVAGMIDRIHTKKVKEILMPESRINLNGSINILEAVLTEKVSKNLPRHIIENLRNLFKLRGKMYPIHKSDNEVLLIFQNLGLANYPPKDWEEAFLKILSLCTHSLQSLVGILQILNAPPEMP